MAGQEWLSVDAAAQRLGITPDAVRSRIKRGTLWAVRRNGRVRVVLRDAPVQDGAVREGGSLPCSEHPVTAPGATPGANGTDPAKNEAAAVRLRSEIAHQKHKVRDLEGARERLERELARQHRYLDMEHALRARLQDQIDRLTERLAEVLPEILDNPTERADRLWKRLGRQVERLEAKPDKRGD